eukprot:scaffold127357_cov23-Tisochrysis_lutea.AAC.1
MTTLTSERAAAASRSSALIDSSSLSDLRPLRLVCLDDEPFVRGSPSSASGLASLRRLLRLCFRTRCSRRLSRSATFFCSRSTSRKSFASRLTRSRSSSLGANTLVALALPRPCAVASVNKTADVRSSLLRRSSSSLSSVEGPERALESAVETTAPATSPVLTDRLTATVT